MAGSTPRIDSTPSFGEARPQPTTALLTGTLTFCFTDIEGSSQRWEQHPRAMPAILARHDAILREAVRAHRGVIFKTVGDSVHAVFARALDALGATLAAQRALQAEPWASAEPMQVRIALHSGVAEERDGDYFGPTLNRVARILALGHVGQVLLSHATHNLVTDDLPPEITLRALGEYQLKDLSRPEQIFQLVSSELPSDFPPLRAARTTLTPAQGLSLLTTKLYAPPPQQLVLRPRLLARLEAALRGKLTLLSAPAGFGKTTLLSAWRATASGRAVPFAWVSLDASDSDPVRFWSYAIAALDTLQPGSGATALALLQSPRPPPIEAALTPLLNALSALPTDAVLVLDDYHLIDAVPIHSAVAFLLDHLPPQLHLVLATRADPPLPLTRLRARGELSELRAADLRFTAAEAAAFLTELMGLPLSADVVAALEARTEGWIAGLQLAALAMRDREDQAGFVRAFSGSNRYVMDYLVEEVLGGLPAHLHTFVLQTSVLERLCGPLCDALVLGGEQGADAGPHAYSQLVIEELERANLFVIPLDDERRWYRYHHLFAEVLRERLRSGATADDVARLHQRASAWYEAAGLIEDAVRSAVLGHDSLRVAALIERHAQAAILKGGNVLLVRAWLEQVPRALVLARPPLALIAGLVLTLTAQFAAAEQLLADAAPAFNGPDVPADVRGQLAGLRATLARFQGDAAGSLAYAQQALSQLAPDNSASRAGAFLNVGVAAIAQDDSATARAALAEAAALGERADIQWIAVAAIEELMSLQGRQGNLQQVFQTAAQVAQVSARLGGQAYPSAGMGLVGTAEVLYERNDLAGAAQASAAATDLLRVSVERLLLVRGHITLAQVCQARGDHEGALASIQQCESWFAQNAIVAGGSAQAWLAAHRARLWVRQGDLAAASVWAQACVFVENSELGYVQRLTLVRVRLAQRQNDRARQPLAEASVVLEETLRAVEARGWTRYLIEGLILQALVYQRQADLRNAQRVLHRALHLAAPEGYVRIFVDEDEPMAALLRAADQHAVEPAYVQRLLTAFPGQQEPRDMRHVQGEAHPTTLLQPLADALVEPLSGRELEVLRLIADGHSNHAIAATLVVAVSTVKRHINNIYGKLAVQSRTQALVRARALHLL